MALGNLAGYSSLGLGGNFSRINPQGERSQVTLDAKLDPKKTNEYSVQISPPVITPPEKISEVKNASKRYPSNDDPVSRAFNAVADYEPRRRNIDIYV